MNHKTGVRLPKKPIIIPERVGERAASRHAPDENGCWISTYSVASHGYAQIGWKNGSERNVVTAHRASWTHFNGPIPEGMTIDHICHVRRCVNPEHLRLMSNIENATGGGGLNLRKPVETDKTCRSGHVVLRYVTGAQHCRECHREAVRAKDARRRARRSGIEIAA